MALNNKATLAVGTGHFYIAPVGTAYPKAAVTSPPTPWEEIGHTSLEDIISFDSEGGEATVMGTLQAPSLRTSYSARSESFAIVLQQFDTDGLKLFYGSNAKVDAVTGLLNVPTHPTPTEKAFLAVFIDGANFFTIYAPRTEIFRGDNFEIADTESFASLPLNVKPLQNGNNDYTYALSPLGVVGG